MTQASEATHYRITVEGVLDALWLQCLGGLEATEQRQPGQSVVTRLEGCLVDQAALQGVLDTLIMLGMRLMLVEWLRPDNAPDTRDCEPGRTQQERPDCR
jgi:hypothetical protein